MEDFPIHSLDIARHFPQLLEIPQPSGGLFMRGSLERIIGTTLVTIVGSRKYSSYGRYACEKIIGGLRGYPVTIVSGLAIGIDAIAHEAALENGLPTIAFPGSGLDERAIYPAQHFGLALRILQAGGALMSEFAHNTRGAPWTFPQRNRLEAGIASMTIVIEAEEKSGTLITSRLATEYNKIVGAVPGPITSPTSAGANWLLKLGAVPVTEAGDVLQELNIPLHDTLPFPAYELNEAEMLIMSALSEPCSRDELLDRLSLDPIAAAIAFSTLEIKGALRETYGRLERII